VKLRTSYLVAFTLAETGALLVMWQAFRDAAEGLQQMANTYANHRCAPEVTVTAELHRVPLSPSFDYYPYVAGEPLVQPPPMADEALARSPHTLGRPQ
jgi:hypothetical protein